MSTPYALEVDQIEKTYGNFRVLKDISMQVRTGAFLTLFGPNGAGKTTLLKVVATLAQPASGTIRVCGFDVQEHPEEARQRLGFLSHTTYLYKDLSPTQNLKFFAKIYSVDDSDSRIDDLLKRLGLEQRKNDPVRSFSRGLQQRLGLARVILHSPEILILDEPYTGLDANAVRILNGILDEVIAEGRTVIMTTHDIELGLRCATDVEIIDRGRIVHSSKADDEAAREAYNRYLRNGDQA